MGLQAFAHAEPFAVTGDAGLMRVIAHSATARRDVVAALEVRGGIGFRRDEMQFGILSGLCLAVATLHCSL